MDCIRISFFVDGVIQTMDYPAQWFSKSEALRDFKKKYSAPNVTTIKAREVFVRLRAV